jgi:hypothetical protein
MQEYTMEMISKVINYIKAIIGDKKVIIALPEYFIAPSSHKDSFLIPSDKIKKIESILNYKAGYGLHILLEYTSDITLFYEKDSGSFNLMENEQVGLIRTIYESIKPHLKSLEDDILDTHIKIEEHLVKYGIGKELEKDIPDTDITTQSKIDLTNLNEKYKTLKAEYESLLLKCENIVIGIQNNMLEEHESVIDLDKQFDRSIVWSYIMDLKGKKRKYSPLFDHPIENEASDISKSYIQKSITDDRSIKPSISNYLKHPFSLFKRWINAFRLFLFKVIAETLLFFNPGAELSLESLKFLTTMKKELSHLRLKQVELESYSPTSFRTNSYYQKMMKSLSSSKRHYSLANQDLKLINYAEKPPLSFDINLKGGKHRFSLLNGVPLLVFIILLLTLISFFIYDLSRPRTELIRINEWVNLHGDKPDIYGMNTNESSSLNGLVLSSLTNNSNEADMMFLSDIKITTSTGLEKQKDIRYNIIQKIRENEERREPISFDEDLQSIQEDLSISKTDENVEEDSSTLNKDKDDGKNEAMDMNQPLSLPDYSKRTLEIEKHGLDLSIEDRIYTIDEFKPAIVGLQDRIDDWYEQTVDFFDRYEVEYDITLEHQQHFLSFINRIDPVKLFEAFNYQYQNHPYLLDRIIKDEMPVIYTAISADARELGLWSKQGIGIFYDISSFDVFRQVFIHELTHDLVERAYGTPIILEGTTEMLAMNIASYMFGEGFSNYKGPVRVAQFLYNRNPKALLDYYIGRREDSGGLPIDLFDKDYIVRSFLNPEVSEDIAEDNTELINSMLDINFDNFIMTNRRVIPLNEIIHTHTEYTPLVLQSDFNYKGYQNSLLKASSVLSNLDTLILDRLRDYVNDEKKVDFYTLLSIGNTIELLEKDKSLSEKHQKTLKRVKQRFDELQEEIIRKDLLYKQNELSQTSKDIFQKNHKPTFSDKEHNQEVEEYKENAGSGTENEVKPEFKDSLSDDESDFVKSDQEKQLREEIVEEGSPAENGIGSTDYGEDLQEKDISNLSDEELEQLVDDTLKYDLNSFSQTINDGYASPEDIERLYKQLLEKWGPGVKELLNDKLNELAGYTNRFDLEGLSGLPNDLELLKKRFELMEEAVKADDTASPNYHDVNDEIWFKILSLIDEEDYTIRYYQLIVDKLISSYYAVDIRSSLSDMKRIASFINTVDFLERYRDDLKEVISSVKTNEIGIKKLGELNTHLKGNLHPYVKSEVLSYLEDFILKFIQDYPDKRFADVFNSSIIDNLKSAELYDILKKAIDSDLLITEINDNLTLHEELYRQVNVKGLSEDYLNLYSKQIPHIVKDSRHATYLDIIFNTERLLVTYFGQSRTSFIESNLMDEFYRVTYDVLWSNNSNFPAKVTLKPYLDEMIDRERYMAMFNLSIAQSTYSQMSYDNFHRIYRNIFLKQLNLYSDYSADFLGFLVNIGFNKAYSNNLYSLLENAYNSYTQSDFIFDPLMTLFDYIALLEEDKVKSLLSGYLVDFLEYYLNYNYFDETNVYFAFLSALGDYISEEAYRKLIRIRYLHQSMTFKDIPAETEILYIIMNMIVSHPTTIDEGLDDETRSLINILSGNENQANISDFEALINLFITQVEKTGILSFKGGAGKFMPEKPYEKAKTLYYESGIVGMLVSAYEKKYGSEDSITVISHLLSIMGLYLYEYGQELYFYGKSGLSNSNHKIGKVLRERYQENPYRPINVLKNNPQLLHRVEESILNNALSNHRKSFNIFFLLAFEDWFWRYFTRNGKEKDEAILIVSEKPSYYGDTFTTGFIEDYFQEILFSKGSRTTYADVRYDLLIIRDYLLPFVISKQGDFMSLFDEALSTQDEEAATFLFRFICGNYLAVGSLYIDFFIEGELTRLFFRKFFLEREDNYGDLYFLLPFKPVEEFSYEEELRRNMINLHYHIFQGLPRDTRYLNDLLEIYKSTLTDLMNGDKEGYFSMKDRIEEEFSKIANLVYLIEDTNIKFQTAEKVYPLVERYIKDREDDPAYLFANYVRKNVGNKSSQIKWNILDSIKSFVFNYKNEVDRLYRKLFHGVATDVLVSYKDYLTDLIKSGYEVQPTEYKVLLEMIDEKEPLKEKSGLDVMKEAYQKAYEKAKNRSFILNKYDSNLKYIISSLKNLISYSSKENNLEQIKKNITHYSKQVSSVFRDLAKSYTDDKQIRLLVSEMAKEIIKLPAKDKFGLFAIFSNVINDYETISKSEYKYYTTLLEHLLTNVFDEIEAESYADFTSIMDSIAMLIVYLDDVLEKNTELTYDLTNIDMKDKLHSLLVLYSHYISLVGISKDANPVNEYILGIYNKTNTLLAREEEAIIASNLLKIKDYRAIAYVNEYLRAPLFRRYLEELSDLDRMTIIDKTQAYINWLSENKTDYDNPRGNQYLLDILGIEGYLDQLNADQQSNYELTNEILKWRNNMVSRLTNFFTETYGYLFTDPQRLYTPSF